MQINKFKTMLNRNKSYILGLILIFPIVLSAQLDFHNEIYYTIISNDLVSSRQRLSSFNFDNGQNSTTGGILGGAGVYYPVMDSYGNNLWIHLTWLRPDPNGTTVGANVPSTNKEATNVYFTTKSIGGWTGFLYEIEIYIDQNQTGTRANKLNGLFPTTIKAASVEFLTTNFPGYKFTELVNFNILDNNSTGWYLDSINFSGKNLKSNPGFSSTKNFTTAGSVVGFTPTFPSGSKDIYAVSLAMGEDYSEFMMSASNVSRFLYGYESNGLVVGQGAQAMTLSFGVPLNIDSCSITILEECLPSGMIKLTAVDYMNRVVQANYKHEILWNIFQKGETKPTQLFNKNPIEVQSGTRYECTSKKYSWKVNIPKTKALADVCKRIVSDTVDILCNGPCDNFELILSSCDDDYDKANALQFTEPTCVSICGPSCDYIIAIFERNGKLIDPKEYDITWSNHQKGAFVHLMGSYYNHISVVVRKGDCTWYGRYIESCENYSNFENIAQTRNNISGEMSKSQLHEFLEQNKSYKLYNVLGQLQFGNHIENGQYILTDGINFKNLFISR